MQENDAQIAARVRSALAPHVQSKSAIKSLALTSGLSEMTVRKIVNTGIISSRSSAAAIEHATRGAIAAEGSVQSGARGADHYGREPAQSILKRAIAQGKGVGAFLRGMGISHHDLWVFMNAPEGKHDKTKSRVRQALTNHEILNDQGQYA